MEFLCGTRFIICAGPLIIMSTIDIVIISETIKSLCWHHGTPGDWMGIWGVYVCSGEGASTSNAVDIHHTK